MQRRKQNIVLVIVASLLINNGAYAQSWWPNIFAQSWWWRVFNPPPAIYNLRPYYHFQPVKSNIDIMQQNVSDAVVGLRIPLGINAEGICTGTFIKTDPSLSYVILLTAGHCVIHDPNQLPPPFYRISNIAFRYRRTAMENWGDNFTENIEYTGIDNEICHIIEAKYDTGENGNTIDDCALIAYPKSVLQSRLSIYEAPYTFFSAFPIPLPIPDTRDKELFVIHHAERQPQRLSELSNAYPDVVQNKHFIHIYTSPFNTLNRFWQIGYWSNGSLTHGSSGAALISPVNGEPTVVGVLSAEFSKDRLNFPEFPPVTPAMTSARKADYGSWILKFYMLSAIAYPIRTYSHITDAEALKGLRVTPVSLVSPSSQYISSQSDLESYSVEVFGIYNYTHVGDATIRTNLHNIRANIHVEQGRINLNSGFSVSASNGVELAIGLISSNISGSALAGRPANPLGATADEVAEKPDNSAAQIQESFKVYPSPTRGIINISPGSYAQAYTVHIMDISGKEVYRDNSPVTGIRHIDLSSKMPAGGTYFLQIQPGEVSTAPVTWKFEVIK